MNKPNKPKHALPAAAVGVLAASAASGALAPYTTTGASPRRANETVQHTIPPRLFGRNVGIVSTVTYICRRATNVLTGTTESWSTRIRSIVNLLNVACFPFSVCLEPFLLHAIKHNQAFVESISLYSYMEARSPDPSQKTAMTRREPRRSSPASSKRGRHPKEEAHPRQSGGRCSVTTLPPPRMRTPRSLACRLVRPPGPQHRHYHRRGRRVDDVARRPTSTAPFRRCR